jgi:adenylate cyclase
VYNKLSIGFDCLGQQHLKNVANPVTGYRVLQVGAATPPRASRPGVRMELATPPRPAKPAQAGLSSAWAWYTGLPRLSAVMIALAVFLFLINVFSGLDQIWFQWPAVPLLLIAIVWAAIRRRPS